MMFNTNSIDSPLAWGIKFMNCSKISIIYYPTHKSSQYQKSSLEELHLISCSITALLIWTFWIYRPVEKQHTYILNHPFGKKKLWLRLQKLLQERERWRFLLRQYIMGDAIMTALAGLCDICYIMMDTLGYNQNYV